MDETCAFPNINESSSEWLTCLAMNNAQRTITISQATLTSWTDVADGGYIYLRFYTTVSGGGYVTLKSGASAETDPEYPHTTISAKCEGGKVVVEVNKAQHISVSGTSEEWDAVPGEPHTLNLNPGTYTLQGESETIEITLP